MFYFQNRIIINSNLVFLFWKRKGVEVVIHAFFVIKIINQATFFASLCTSISKPLLCFLTENTCLFYYCYCYCSQLTIIPFTPPNRTMGQSNFPKKPCKAKNIGGKTIAMLVTNCTDWAVISDPIWPMCTLLEKEMSSIWNRCLTAVSKPCRDLSLTKLKKMNYYSF